ncbi:type II toxin-antitoxin system HipA family toxin [Herbaspirillum sp. YR522]|uniref:type II toxin-antitoxin system HipA family toxin n=1 Tax=Herbaspirillum sp. YR522 TaxID=1144342 RepID=UPI00026F5313|nr:HipA domain-containing protein [Herbaspirillum sp. YR522]EJN10329.1 HipA-like protein [Herbaspirillum sp. YR522]
MSTSERPVRLYVYLQRPDNGQWVTVGRYSLQRETEGRFLYAPSYADAGLGWAIDPVNLPFKPGIAIGAPRYRGLHDVLRDACPDSWGQAIIRKQKGLSDSAHPYQFLVNARNADRWGALAIGTSPRPSVDHLSSPRLENLADLVVELSAMAVQRPPVNKNIRKMLVAAPSLGGARPKGVVQDGDDYWLVKPRVPSDTADVPLLEHMAARLGRAVGLDFADTVYQTVGDAISVVRVKRFDRRGDRRLMAISGATMLSTEFPGGQVRAEWSYPRLAEELQRIGAGPDRQELFLRMVYNAVLGNDDDHPRNHAAIYDSALKRWRLSPAFDVVPNWDDSPAALAMQTSLGRYDISRQSILADAGHFGLSSTQAPALLDDFLDRLDRSGKQLASQAPAAIQAFFHARISHGVQLLRGGQDPAVRSNKFE